VGRQKGRGFSGPESRQLNERVRGGTALGLSCLVRALRLAGRNWLRKALAAEGQGAILAVWAISPHFSDPQFPHL